MLRYMLDVETRGSQSLLNVQAFTDPTAYKLKVKRPGSDESREVNVDLLETFNWLIGLTVQHIAAPQSFTRRVRARRREAAAPEGPAQAGRRRPVVVPHRHRHDARRPQDARHLAQAAPGRTREQDNLVLDEWFTKQGYSTKDSEFDLIYVNGGNNLENLKAARRHLEGAADRGGLPPPDVRDGGRVMASVPTRNARPPRATTARRCPSPTSWC